MLGNLIAEMSGPRVVEESALYRKLMDIHLTDSGRVTMPRRRPDSSDVSTYSRASGLGKLCARRDALQIRDRIAFLGRTKPEYMMSFMIGHSTHEMIQNSLIPSIAEPHRILGWWRRSDNPKAVMSGFDEDGRPMLFRKTEAAEFLGTMDLVYEEVAIVDREYMLTGHPDGVMDWSGIDLPEAVDGLEVQEYKTIDQSMWDSVDPAMGGAPDEGYVMQIHAYMWQLGIEHGRIIYFKKGERRPSEGIVEWMFTLDESVVESLKARLTAYHKAIHAAHDEGIVPDERLSACTAYNRFPASFCPVAHECFGKSRRKAANYRAMTIEEIARWAQ